MQAGGSVVVHSPQRPIPGGEPVEWHGFKDCYRVAPRPEIRAEGMIEHFVTCIREGREPKCSGNSGRYLRVLN